MSDAGSTPGRALSPPSPRRPPFTVATVVWLAGVEFFLVLGEEFEGAVAR